VSIYFHTEDLHFNLPEKRITRNWIYSVILSYNRVPGDINFIFCSNDYLLEINKSYLNHHYYTDVITFNLAEGAEISGDVFISVDKVKENAKVWNVSFKSECLRVMIHGVLHLLGFDDNNEESRKEMKEMEDKALSLLEK